MLEVTDINHAEVILRLWILIECLRYGLIGGTFTRLTRTSDVIFKIKPGWRCLVGCSNVRLSY